MQKMNLNFAPQLGIAWDRERKGNIVLRAGIGPYYENGQSNHSEPTPREGEC
jgi:hypothetical protein